MRIDAAMKSFITFTSQLSFWVFLVIMFVGWKWLFSFDWKQSLFLAWITALIISGVHSIAAAIVCSEQERIAWRT